MKAISLSLYFTSFMYGIATIWCFIYEKPWKLYFGLSCLTGILFVYLMVINNGVIK